MTNNSIKVHPQGDVLFRLTVKEEQRHSRETATSAKTVQSAASISIETPSTDDTICFLVSLAALTIASPVFKTMLETKSNGGAESQVVEILLPDDDPKAFELLMNIAHNKTKQIPRRIAIKALLDLAILADKYQMAEALEVHVEYMWMPWLRRSRPNKFTGDLPSWLSISWIFRLAEDFKHLTRVTMLYNADSSFRSGLGLPLPDRLLAQMEVQRLSGLRRVFELIQAQVNSLSGSQSVCTYHPLGTQVEKPKPIPAPKARSRGVSFETSSSVPPVPPTSPSPNTKPTLTNIFGDKSPRAPIVFGVPSTPFSPLSKITPRSNIFGDLPRRASQSTFSFGTPSMMVRPATAPSIFGGSPIKKTSIAKRVTLTSFGQSLSDENSSTAAASAHTFCFGINDIGYSLSGVRSRPFSFGTNTVGSAPTSAKSSLFGPGPLERTLSTSNLAPPFLNANASTFTPSTQSTIPSIFGDSSLDHTTRTTSPPSPISGTSSSKDKNTSGVLTGVPSIFAANNAWNLFENSLREGPSVNSFGTESNTPNCLPILGNTVGQEVTSNAKLVSGSSNLLELVRSTAPPEHPAASVHPESSSTSTLTPNSKTGTLYRSISPARTTAVDRRTSCDAMMLGSLIKSAAKVGLWPVPVGSFDGLSLHEVVVSCHMLQCESLCYVLDRLNRPFKGEWDKAHGIDDSLDNKLDELYEVVVGLDIADFA